MIALRMAPEIQLEDGRFLFSAVSHVGGRLILAGIPYLDRAIDYDAVKISLSREPASPAFDRFMRTEYEPCLILSADIGEAPVSVEIGYEGKSWTVAPEPETLLPSRLSLMTLFQHDYRMLPEFVRHYTTLGVEQFHLYFNGALAEHDWAFLRECDTAREAQIFLYEWDIPYWWKLSQPAGFAQYDAQGFQHHAQTMAMNHHLHRMKGNSRYTFFVDLDEYVFTPKAMLDAAFERLISYIQFTCWWMAPEPPESYENFSIADKDKPIAVTAASEGAGRTKCLVRVLDVDIMGVHWPHTHLGRRNFLSDGYFHIYRFPGVDRTRELASPVTKTTQARFLKERFAGR